MQPSYRKTYKKTMTIQLRATNELAKNKTLFKTESTRTSSNIYLSWTKIEYQNNLNPIALFSTLNKR